MTETPAFPSRLLRGYAAFRDQRLPQESARYRILAETGQRPRTMIIGCCDSRAAPETIFDAAPGELFVIRNVANLVPPYDPDGEYHGTSAAIEFGVMGLKVRYILVMGHGRCGGVQAYIASRDAGANAPEEPSAFIGKWISLVAHGREAGLRKPGGCRRSAARAGIRLDPPRHREPAHLPFDPQSRGDRRDRAARRLVRHLDRRVARPRPGDRPLRGREGVGSIGEPSWPGLSRPSNDFLQRTNKTWMPGTSPGMTLWWIRCRGA